jgi:hypothetical protein
MTPILLRASIAAEIALRGLGRIVAYSGLALAAPGLLLAEAGDRLERGAHWLYCRRFDRSPGRSPVIGSPQSRGPLGID